jgi:MFS family permease
LSIALLAPLAGLAIDRIGRRVLLLAGILLFVVSGSAGLYQPDLPTIFMSRIVLGIAVAFIMTAQTALVGDYFTGEARSVLTGLQISARNFGGLAFILVAGMVAAVSPRWAFGVYGLALLVLPISWMAIVEPGPALSVRQARDTFQSGERQAWRLPFWGLVVLQSLTNMFFFVMPTQLPFFLDAQGYSSATMTGLTLSVLMLSGGSVALLYTRIQRVIGYAGVFAAGYAAMAAGFLLLVTSAPLLILVGAV